MSAPDLTFGTRTPAAPVSVACWMPLRSLGPPTRMKTGVGFPSPTAVSIPNASSCESGELIGSITSQSKPAALIELATSGEALCSTTPTVGRTLSFARKELWPNIVATDHAPHPVEAKECEWDAAANGMVGLESALSVVQQTMVDTGLMGWADVARVLSATPARIGRLTGHGEPVAAGSAAELTLVDPAASAEFGTDRLAGRSANSPYLGRTLPGRVVATFHRGVPTVLDGAVRPAEEVARG